MCFFQSVKFELHPEERKNMYCAESKQRYSVFENPNACSEYQGDNNKLFWVIDVVKQPWHTCFIEPGILIRGFDSREDAERYAASL